MNDKLKLLKIENFIWYIYFFIVAFSLLSNYFEKKYILFKHISDYKKYKNINITIFFVAFIIYLYFVSINIKNNNQKKTTLSLLSLIASILFLVGGIIYLYIEIKSKDQEEIAII